MRKTILSLLILPILAINPAHADEYNPFFGDHERQFGFHMGAGVNSGLIVPPPEQFVPFAMVQIQYSLPTTFFEMPARYSLNVVETIGWGRKYGWEWQDYSIPIAYLSEDIALFWGEDWYFGTGLGVGMQAQQNDRIGSKLLFGFKLMAGYHITERINIELFMQHFSNGNTAPENNSYAFYGLGLVYNF